MNRWMSKLAEHHRIMRRLYPEDELIVVFDIDDTILDLRHMVLHVLAAFDRHHDTAYFRDLSLHNVRIDEPEVRGILAAADVPGWEQQRVMSWFQQHSWSAPVIRHGHQPFPGVMEVIRRLRSEERTSVGINTGRPESVRDETLTCLNAVGTTSGVRFDDHLLYMSIRDWGEKVVESKVEGMKYFQGLGFRIAAFIDNEPENLRAVADFDRSHEILLLHADTVFASGRHVIPEKTVSGNVYDLSQLVQGLADKDTFGAAA